METAYLDSLSLSPFTISAIQTEIQAIQANNLKSIKLRIANGQHCRNIKAFIGHGGWINWLVAESGAGYGSVRTVERDMALAERLYDRLPEIEKIDSATNLSALFELCRANAHEDALETALHLMDSGVRVTSGMAGELTEVYAVSPAMGEAVRDGKMTVSEAHMVVRRLEEIDAPEPVRKAVATHTVKSAGVVDALAVLHQQEPGRFQEVVVSGTIWNPVAGVEVPLAEASAADGFAMIETEEAERMARQQAHIKDWKNRKSPRLGVVHGRREDIVRQVADLIPDNEQQYTVYVYPADVPQPVQA